VTGAPGLPIDSTIHGRGIGPHANGRAARQRHFSLTRNLAAIAMLLTFGGCATSVNGPLPVRPSPERALHIDCRGHPTGAPTVVLEAGAFGTSADWDRVLKDLAKSGRACAYDRRGLGASPPRRTPPDAENIARDLASALDARGETSPVIIVGHSNGAFYAETFATLFPERTAGVAYVDGVGTDDLDAPLVLSELQKEQARARLAVVGARLGLAKFVVQGMIDGIGLKGRAALHKWLALTSLRHLTNSRNEVMRIIPSLHSIKTLGGPMPTIPTAALVATLDPSSSVDKAWRAAQVAPARRACQGWVLDMVGATHVSPLGRDRAYIIAAVRWLESPGLKAAQTCSQLRFKS
jgi:pimeloyl-ACP methyl ester carboxylesterase